MATPDEDPTLTNAEIKKLDAFRKYNNQCIHFALSSRWASKKFMKKGFLKKERLNLIGTEYYRLTELGQDIAIGLRLLDE